MAADRPPTEVKSNVLLLSLVLVRFQEKKHKRTKNLYRAPNVAASLLNLAKQLRDQSSLFYYVHVSLHVSLFRLFASVTVENEAFLNKLACSSSYMLQSP